MVSVSTKDGFKNNQCEFALVTSSFAAAALSVTHSLAKYKSFKTQDQQSVYSQVWHQEWIVSLELMESFGVEKSCCLVLISWDPTFAEKPWFLNYPTAREFQFFCLLFLIKPSGGMESFQKTASASSLTKVLPLKFGEGTMPWLSDGPGWCQTNAQLHSSPAASAAHATCCKYLRSRLARRSLWAWTHLGTHVCDCNCLSLINIITGHNPTKGVLLTIIFKVSLIRRWLQFPESVFLFYFREKVSNVWYHCANIFNST